MTAGLSRIQLPKPAAQHQPICHDHSELISIAYSRLGLAKGLKTHMNVRRTKSTDTDDDIGDADEAVDVSDIWGSQSQASPAKKPKLNVSDLFFAKTVLDADGSHKDAQSSRTNQNSSDDSNSSDSEDKSSPDKTQGKRKRKTRHAEDPLSSS
ncbi:hypothetical protein NDU88_006013 [Pleurodeles waltl]|uniref:Uncharacterized protein n=1 Tax=Pleurodeles waltl TaxID=8319 RepID=A0AAV7QJY2_PLEWA|nr:hypothetical protein NDU88_006013 [Pleurodeles waltl]